MDKQTILIAAAYEQLAAQLFGQVSRVMRWKCVWDEVEESTRDNYRKRARELIGREAVRCMLLDQGESPEVAKEAAYAGPFTDREDLSYADD